MKSTSAEFATRASLLERLRGEREEDAWQEFYDLYWRPVYGYARRYGLGSEDAEDVVQDVMVAAARAMPAFAYHPDRGRFRGWMGTLARRKVIDRLRRRAARVPAAACHDMPGDADDVADPRTENTDERWEREWALGLLSLAMERVANGMPPGRWEAFRRYVLEEETPASVAADCGLSVDALYVLKHRVVVRIREEASRLRADGWG
jgi:RNA polymerase sigma-70 factor (ECF subfamily)